MAQSERLQHIIDNYRVCLHTKYNSTLLPKELCDVNAENEGEWRPNSLNSGNVRFIYFAIRSIQPSR
jgi:hypothetical protein